MNHINEQNKEWRDLRFYGINSQESERELEKLAQFGKEVKLKSKDEDALMNKNVQWSLMSNVEFQDLLAPFDLTEDFSSAQLMKNSGPNITLEQLSALQVPQMVDTILKKAGMVEYERLYRHLVC